MLPTIFPSKAYFRENPTMKEVNIRNRATCVAGPSRVGQTGTMTTTIKTDDGGHLYLSYVFKADKGDQPATATLELRTEASDVPLGGALDVLAGGRLSDLAPQGDGDEALPVVADLIKVPRVRYDWESADAHKDRIGREVLQELTRRVRGSVEGRRVARRLAEIAGQRAYTGPTLRVADGGHPCGCLPALYPTNEVEPEGHPARCGQPGCPFRPK